MFIPKTKCRRTEVTMQNDRTTLKDRSNSAEGSHDCRRTAGHMSVLFDFLLWSFSKFVCLCTIEYLQTQGAEGRKTSAVAAQPLAILRFALSGQVRKLSFDKAKKLLKGVLAATFQAKQGTPRYIKICGATELGPR